MKTIILDRSDINNPLHPNLWEGICDDLDLGPTTKRDEYPEQIILKVHSAKDADELVAA